jgi:hypothetical protein
MGLAEPFQSLNSLLMTNAKSMYLSLDDFTTSRAAAHEFAMKSGALIAETVQDLKDYANGKDLQGKLFYYTGFNAGRRANLILAANAGKHYAIELNDKLIRNPTDAHIHEQLKSIGLDAQKLLKHGLTQEDTLIAGRRVAEATQFMNSPLDTPLGWHKSPLMRLVFLYKSFAYNQGRFLLDQLGNSLKRGKYENLAYFTVLFPVMGEVLGDLETLTRGRDPFKDRPREAKDRYIDNIVRLGGFGIASGIVGAFNRQNIAEWVMGPVISDGLGGAQALINFATADKQKRKKVEHQILRKASRNIPVVGPAVEERLIKTPQERAQDRRRRLLRERD